MPHSLDLFKDDELDEESDAFDLDVDMNERDNVDNLDSLKSGALLSISRVVSTFLVAYTTFPTSNVSSSCQIWFVEISHS